MESWKDGEAVLKPTTEILERMERNSKEHPDGVHTRLYRYLLREDMYYSAYQKLYSNKGAATKGSDNDTADGFGKIYVDKLIADLTNGTYEPKPVRREYKRRITLVVCEDCHLAIHEN
jgi:retron-type reverse transcriptase